MNKVPGWYGKLPALGDFARRRLPHAFVERWDAWLQQCLPVSRNELGDAWLSHYLGMPVWRFLLLPGAIGAEGWAGVLLPSVDRVGRHFPLTVCARLQSCAPFGTSLAALEHWLTELEACALLGLDAESGHLRMEAALQDLFAPACAASTEEVANASLPGTQGFRTGSAGAGCLDGLAARLLPQSLAGESLWWCCGPGDGCAGFSCQGLPPPQAFAAMLRGRTPAAPAQTGSTDLEAIDRSSPA